MCCCAIMHFIIRCKRLNRYIVRTILVPFLFEPPAVEVGRLEKILSLAPAAFPDLLKIGKKVVSECSALNSKLYSVRDKVESFFPNGLDSRLATQYALSILCCEMVYIAQFKHNYASIFYHYYRLGPIVKKL